jgi:hypothetical protein
MNYYSKIAIGVGILFFTLSANANDYLGEFCWNFSSTNEVAGSMRVGVTRLGDGHFLVSGKATVTTPINGQFPVFGNAEWVDGDIVLTVTNAGVRNGIIGIDLTKAVLDPSTLDGTSEWIGTYSDAVELATGSFTYTECP